MVESEKVEKSSVAPRPAVTPRPSVRPFLAAFAAWLLPGAGHFYLGRRRRALVFSLLVLASLIIGCSLDGNLYRIVPNQPLSYLATLGTMGMGVPYFVLRFVMGYHGDVVAPGYEYGTAFVLTAGLMNLLLVLDVWDLARGVDHSPVEQAGAVSREAP